MRIIMSHCSSVPFFGALAVALPPLSWIHIMISAKRVIYMSTLCSAFTLLPQVVWADFTIANEEWYGQSLNGSETGTVQASGILRTQDQSAIVSNGNLNIINNFGRIWLTNYNVPVPGIAGINSLGSEDTITNTGTITALINNNSFNQGISISGNGTSVTNTGTISLYGNNSTGIQGNNASFEIYNSGTIGVSNGGLAIDGGDGDVKLTLETGSVINGDIDLGGGSNTLTAIGAMTLNDDIIDAGVFTSETGLGDQQTFNGIISGADTTLNINGEGKVILSGNNTYTGNTTINAGTLSISNNNNLGDSSARLIFDGGTLETTADLTISSGRNISLNNGGGTIDTGDNAVTYNGNFASSNGGLTKLGSGTFEHTGNSAYRGVTTIAEGTLIISNLSNGGDYINNGTLVFNKETGTGSNMYLNGLSGAGSLIKEGGGVLLLNGDKTYTGNTYINNGFIQAQGNNALGVNGAVTVAEEGQLDIWTNLSIGSLAGNGTINLSNRYGGTIGNTLTVGGDDTSTAFNGLIYGLGGSLTKTGDGKLTLAGINTYTGSTTVNRGLLEVNGSLASEVRINSGGTLGGRGHLGSVLVSGGRLAPGNSIGSLNVDSVDFSGGGVYEVEVDAAGHSDLLAITGTATLTGGSVQVIPEDGNYQPSTDYTILTAGAINGQFDSVNSTLAFLDPTLSYTSNEVMLRLDRNNQSFASVAGTSNQQAVAQTLDTLSQTTNLTMLTDNLLLLTAEGANSAYDSLSGVQHSNTQQLQNRVGQQFRGVLSRRMNAPVSFALGNELTQFATIADVEALPATAAGGFDPARGFWIEGMGGQGDIDGDRNAGGVDYDFYGIAGGVDWGVAQNWVAGAAFGYTRTDADMDNGGLNVDSYMGALYGTWQPSAFYLNGNLTFGLHSTDASRQVNVGTFSERADADYDSVSVQAAVEAGQTLQTTAAGFDVTPFVGLEAFTDSRESFTESGAGVANLDVDRERMESLQSSVGVRFENIWTTDGGKTLMPMLELAWVHEYLDETATLNAGFAAAPSSRFSVEGSELDRNRARVGAGIGAKLSEASQLTLGYQGEFAGSDDNHMISARYRMEW